MSIPPIELNDIQATVLRPRPSPYKGEYVVLRIDDAVQDLPQVSIVYRMKFSELPGGRNSFGFKDGLHNPRLEGSSLHIPPGSGLTIKAGEFIMGYPDELGQIATSPEPEMLRHNRTFVVFRKFHTKVSTFRNYLREQALSPQEEELIAAKMVGRWRSGAPLVLAPDDDPNLGTDPNCNNDFNYSVDIEGLKYLQKFLILISVIQSESFLVSMGNNS